MIATAWGTAVVAGILYRSCVRKSTRAHQSSSYACGGDSFKPLSNVGLFWAVQFLGTLAGVAPVWIVHFPHWRETPDPATKVAVFGLQPAIRNLTPNSTPR